MRKLLASVALLATISACSQEAEEPAAVEETAAAAAPAATLETYAGAWNVTRPDGSTHVTTNNADGTFTRTYPDGGTESGTWTLTADRGCWTVEGGTEACYTISDEDAAGTVTLTADDGAVVTATRVVEEAAEAAE